MNKLSYSLIIPTRNRSETALAAIESALWSEYPYLQIVVSDNSDSDDLHLLLKQRGWLDKVTYHRTEACLSMRDNWERGVDLSTGDIVSVMGDDDAVMPDAFSIANYAFHHLDIDSLRSETAIYKWDSYPYWARRNYLSFLMGEEIKLVRNPRDLLRAAIDYRVRLGTGPGIYYGFMKREFLNRVRSIRGKWFVDPIPDFDSGFATLMYARAYAVSVRPLFVQGHSGKSNSGAMRVASVQRRNMASFASEAKIDVDGLYVGALSHIKSVNAVIVSCQLRMMDEARIVLRDPNLNLNLKGAWHYLLDGVRGGYDKMEFLASVVPLDELADEWNIPPEERGTLTPGEGTLGLLFEQGFGKPKVAPEHETTGIDRSSWGYNTIVVNGRTMGFRSILDAVKFIQSVFPTLLKSPSEELVMDFRGAVDKKSAKQLSEARMAKDEGDVRRARCLIDAVLADDICHRDANILLEEILIGGGEVEELARLYALWFSYNPTLEVLYKLLDVYVSMGQKDLAVAVVRGLVRNNPRLAEDERVADVVSEADR